MSRVFVDEDLMSWEAYASGGDFGLAVRPKIVFNCLSQPDLRARFIVHRGDNADAEELVHTASPERLLELLRRSEPLN